MTNQRLAIGLVVLLFPLAGPAGSGAQVQPLGLEFQVNVFTTGSQDSPQAAVAPDGSFTVIWECSNPACPGGLTILGRRYDGQGVPLGGELTMSESGASWPSDVGTDAAGNFVLVWGAGLRGPFGGTEDYIKGRRFTSAAVPREGQFAVSDPPGNYYTGDSAVSVRDDGSFVVVWDDYEVSFARPFDVDGLPQAPAFQVAESDNYSRTPAVAVEPGGGFVVAWTSFDLQALSRGILAQRFDADGARAGHGFPILDPIESFGGSDLMVEPDGTLAAVFGSGGDPLEMRVRVRRFDGEGQQLGSELLVDSWTGVHGDFGVSAARAPDGSFVVVWESLGSPGTDSSDWSVQARRFDAEWTPLGPQFQVNSLTTGDQIDSSLAIQPSGDFVVTWRSDVSGGTDDSEFSIQARRFHPPFFIDGFDSGDTSRWSATFPARGTRDSPAPSRR